jgi:RimJ/RimL family protein N-acetyltransferase
MSTGLLFDCDEAVATQFLEPRGQLFFKYDRAIGLVDHGKLVGAVLLHGWNGSNIELSYSGQGTMTVGVVRFLASYLITEFDVARLTVVTSKRNRHLIRFLQNLGFKLEGVQRCYYGKKDNNRNAGVRFVAFRDAIERVARVPGHKGELQCL